MPSVTIAASPGRTELPSATSRRLLLVSTNPRTVRRMSRILRAMGVQLEVVNGLDAREDFSAYDVVLADYETLEAHDRTQLVAGLPGKRRPMRAMLLSAGDCREELVELFGNGILTNLVARNGEEDENDLIVTLQKLLRRDIFGLEKYFGWGVEPRILTLRHSSRKGQVLEEADAYARTIGVHARLGELYCSVADEFLTNAVYNAPVDASGNYRFTHLPRAVEVQLEPGEDIQVQFCSDGRRLGISVTDPFGSLSPDRLLGYLSKCFRGGENQMDQKAGGAGLGFYMAFQSLNHLVVNIAPGRKTEMIGLIDIRGNYREFAMLNKSFNIFVGEPA